MMPLERSSAIRRSGIRTPSPIPEPGDWAEHPYESVELPLVVVLIDTADEESQYEASLDSPHQRPAASVRTRADVALAALAQPRHRKQGLMSQYLLQRLFLNVPVIILVITIVFLMGRARPDFA